jgi:heme/copper-type cytochrome/quinol oxidase subunit 3
MDFNMLMNSICCKELNTIMGAFNTAVLLTSSNDGACDHRSENQKVLSILQLITIFLALFF